MTDDPALSSASYVSVLNALNVAHRVITDQTVEGELPGRLVPVLDALDEAIRLTLEAKR